MSTRFRYCGELLSNAGFETAGGGGADVFGSWTETPGDGAIASEASLVHGGSKAAKLTAGASSNTTLRQTIVVRPGFTYTLTFYTRGDATHDGKYQIYDVTNGANIVAATDTGVVGETYTLVTVNFTAPAACVSVYIYLGCPVENGGIAYFDDISVLPADFDFDADAERTFEPVGESVTAGSGKLYYNPYSTTGLRKCWHITLRNIDPDEADMVEAAYKAAVLDGSAVYWMGWDETTATKVRTKPEEWKDVGSHRANGTVLRTINFTLREETPT